MTTAVSRLAVNQSPLGSGGSNPSAQTIIALWCNPAAQLILDQSIQVRVLAGQRNELRCLVG